MQCGGVGHESARQAPQVEKQCAALGRCSFPACPRLRNGRVIVVPLRVVGREGRPLFEVRQDQRAQSLGWAEAKGGGVHLKCPLHRPGEANANQIVLGHVCTVPLLWPDCKHNARRRKRGLTVATGVATDRRMQEPIARKGHEIKVRIESEIKTEIRRRAAMFGRTVSQHVRELIRGDLASARGELAEVSRSSAEVSR